MCIWIQFASTDAVRTLLFILKLSKYEYNKIRIRCKHKHNISLAKFNLKSKVVGKSLKHIGLKSCKIRKNILKIKDFKYLIYFCLRRLVQPPSQVSRVV